MKFWDTSAAIPLFLNERTSSVIRTVFDDDGMMLVWWGTEVECVSSVTRKEREGVLDAAQAGEALSLLAALKGRWQEVSPVEPVRRTASRLLRTHPLRAADALQLAAALTGAEGDPSSLEFVCLDRRLCEIADREGLVVVEIPPPSG